MKLTTNDRELVCVLIALNSARPETSHSNRKRKLRAFEQLGLDRIETLAEPGAERERVIPSQWPLDIFEANIESGTRDYLVERLGADGEIAGGAFVERTICRFVDKLIASE